MKQILLQCLSALLVCAMLCGGLALAESADVDAPVDELNEFIIGGDDGQSIEGIEETPADAADEPVMIEVGFDGAPVASDAAKFEEPGTEEVGGQAGEVLPKADYYTRLPNSGNYSTLSFTLGDTLWIYPDFASNAGVSVTGYKSSKPKVATIDANGRITTLTEGTTKITVTTTNKKIKATMSLKVVDPYKPEKIYINQGKSATLYLNQVFPLTTRLEPGTAKATLTWTSSKPAVASVDANGRVTAHKEGSAKITVKTHNGRKATFKVKVDGIYVNPNVHYRALLVGQCNYTYANDLPGDRDVALMEKMLNSLRGPEGNTWTVNRQTDRNVNQIYSDIRWTFSGATNNDVSLFFISCHGDDSTSYSYYGYQRAGALLTPDGSRLSLHQLAAWLNDIPGKVIVLIDSCGSGAAIYPYGSKSAGAFEAFDPESFDEQVVEAFSGLDKGVSAPWDSNQGAFILTNKFYVMTASAYREYSWCTNKYSYFTKWLTDGVKTKGKMPADGDKNKFLTLNELYNYIRSKSDKQTFRSNGYVYRQHTQVYPANSGFELFYRK